MSLGETENDNDCFFESYHHNNDIVCNKQTNRVARTVFNNLFDLKVTRE